MPAEPADSAADSPRAIRVLLCEPDAVLASALSEALRPPRFAARLYGGDAADLEAAAKAHEADVALVGPTFGPAGLDTVIRRLLAGDTRTLIVSATPLDDAGTALLLAGASGFLLVAEASLSDLAGAVASVSAGATALHPSVVHAVLDLWRRQRSDGPTHRLATRDAAATDLSSRELEVLRLLADGLTTRLIAARLGVAEKTVESHKSKLYAKLGARNQAHAVQIAAAQGIT